MKTKMTIEKWKEILSANDTPKVESRLKDVLDCIKFLESIYMTGGENHFYSESFSDAAYNEREQLCLLSSACYSVLRDRKKQLTEDTTISDHMAKREQEREEANNEN